MAGLVRCEKTHMNNIITSRRLALAAALVSFVTLLACQVRAQPNRNPAFGLAISELKPFGNDRFVEISNGQDSAVDLDMIWIRNETSGPADSFGPVHFNPHGLAAFPVRCNFSDHDAVMISAWIDTAYETVCGMSFYGGDTVHSFGWCPYLTRMTPTPGAPNLCASPESVLEIPDGPSVRAITAVAMTGQEIMIQECDQKNLRAVLPRGLYVLRIEYDDSRCSVSRVAVF